MSDRIVTDVEVAAIGTGTIADGEWDPHANTVPYSDAAYSPTTSEPAVKSQGALIHRVQFASAATKHSHSPATDK